MSKFKIGERVVYNKGKADEDRGVIIKICEYAVCFEDGVRWWVKWDSDGDTRHTSEQNLEHETNTEQCLPNVLVINGVRYIRAN